MQKTLSISGRIDGKRKPEFTFQDGDRLECVFVVHFAADIKEKCRQEVLFKNYQELGNKMQDSM